MKTKSKLISLLSAVIFVLAEARIFTMIHITKEPAEISLHYLSIQIAALFIWLTLAIELIFGEKGSRLKVLFNLKDGNLLRIAFIFTLAADYYLVANGAADKLTGMIYFIGTQIFIFLHLLVREESAKRRAANLITRLSLSVVLVAATFIVLGKNADPLAIVSIIYYANLLTSMIFAPFDKRGGKLLFVGLLLFALCDVNVGLWALNDMYQGFPEGSILYNILHSGVDLVWIFYLPSQTIIPLTVLIKKSNITASQI
jgi:hypothetical protein